MFHHIIGRLLNVFISHYQRNFILSKRFYISLDVNQIFVQAEKNKQLSRNTAMTSMKMYKGINQNVFTASSQFIGFSKLHIKNWQMFSTLSQVKKKCWITLPLHWKPMLLCLPIWIKIRKLCLKVMPSVVKSLHY